MLLFSTGKPPKSLPDLLREYGLPQGLFPRNIICYEFDESTSKLIVHLPSACEISFKDSSVLRYAKRVKCTLSRGKLSGIEGMKTKVLVWVKVTQVGVESYKSDKICFMAGVKKLRTKDAYDTPRDSIKVDEFWVRYRIARCLPYSFGWKSCLELQRLQDLYSCLNLAMIWMLHELCCSHLLGSLLTNLEQMLHWSTPIGYAICSSFILSKFIVYEYIIYKY